MERTFGHILRDIRLSRGLTLESLAADAGVSVPTLSRIETGKRRPSPKMIYALATALEMPVEDLMAQEMASRTEEMRERVVEEEGIATRDPRPRRPHGESLRQYRLNAPQRAQATWEYDESGRPVLPRAIPGSLDRGTQIDERPQASGPLGEGFASQSCLTSAYPMRSPYDCEDSGPQEDTDPLGFAVSAAKSTAVQMLHTLSRIAEGEGPAADAARAAIAEISHRASKLRPR